jgi:hypothetical protein
VTARSESRRVSDYDFKTPDRVPQSGSKSRRVSHLFWKLWAEFYDSVMNLAEFCTPFKKLWSESCNSALNLAEIQISFFKPPKLCGKPEEFWKGKGGLCCQNLLTKQSHSKDVFCAQNSGWSFATAFKNSARFIDRIDFKGQTNMWKMLGLGQVFYT